MKPTSSQSDLTLLVQQEGRIDQEVFLQHGITIGRAASNTVCIEDSEVEHIHARVLRQADGSFPKDTINHMVDQRLSELHKSMRGYYGDLVASSG